jgi:DNA-binding transcriptional ArsR family regulator
MGETIPQDVFEIEDLETLKTIADPLRTQILERLVDEPKTVKEVAADLGLAPSRLYYHVNLLEEHGLIQVVDQRMVGNLVEKVYRATAYKFKGAESLLSFDTREGKAMINTMFDNVLEATREDLLRSLEARTYALEMGAPERPRMATVNRQVYRIPESTAEELQARLTALMDDFADAAVDGASATEDDPTHTYAFMAAFYPRFDYSEAEAMASPNVEAPDTPTLSEKG